jgi:hypothetical protein
MIQSTPYGSCTAIGGPSQNHWLRKTSQMTRSETVQSTTMTMAPVMTIIQRQFQWRPHLDVTMIPSMKSRLLRISLIVLLIDVTPTILEATGELPVYVMPAKMCEKKLYDDLVHSTHAQQVPEAADVLFEVRSLHFCLLDEEPRRRKHGNGEHGHDDHELREAQREVEVAAVLLAVEEETRQQLTEDHHRRSDRINARLRLAALVNRFTLSELHGDAVSADVGRHVAERRRT